mmetsp:Transcript_9664/g.14640  ORF Transcript_9664/g.14640 Transcript_9664/m.14640 type:complete len:222 (-) Transcript_9664:147-812(-)
MITSAIDILISHINSRAPSSRQNTISFVIRATNLLVTIVRQSKPRLIIGMVLLHLLPILPSLRRRERDMRLETTLMSSSMSMPRFILLLPILSLSLSENTENDIQDRLSLMSQFNSEGSSIHKHHRCHSNDRRINRNTGRQNTISPRHVDRHAGKSSDWVLCLESVITCDLLIKSRRKEDSGIRNVNRNLSSSELLHSEDVLSKEEGVSFEESRETVVATV